MRKNNVSNTYIASLCTELSLLLHAGIGLGDGLHLLAEEEDDSGPRALLTSMAEQMDRGRPLAAVLREAACFPAYVPGLVEVGERSGCTEEALQALARYYESRERQDRRIRSALLYPSILLLLILIVIVVLLARVLPVFNEVYASLGGQLTGLAGGLLSLGRILDTGMPVLCVLLAAAVCFLTAFAAGGAFRERVLGLWQRRWGDRGVSRTLHTAHFAQALAMGLRSGLPVEEALELASAFLRDVPAAQVRCRDCRSRMEEGAGLPEALRQSGVLPPASCRMLALGMRGGNGDTVMEEIARRLSEEAEDALEAQVSRVEPTLVIVTSVLVGVILLSVMLPLMHIMTVIG